MYHMTGHMTSFCVVTEGKSGQSSSETHWVLKASLVDSRTSVNDVKFAPRHLGLMLVGQPLSITDSL